MLAGGAVEAGPEASSTLSCPILGLGSDAPATEAWVSSHGSRAAAGLCPRHLMFPTPTPNCRNLPSFAPCLFYPRGGSLPPHQHGGHRHHPPTVRLPELTSVVVQILNFITPPGTIRQTPAQSCAVHSLHSHPWWPCWHLLLMCCCSYNPHYSYIIRCRYPVLTREHWAQRGQIIQGLTPARWPDAEV